MTSNILAGERRWASARRTGMTVLGKVSVPKPLNLPSQRLENHGLDPNVEIVPKGSLGWGSRPSSSASNPWGSTTQSSNADGSVSSPSQLSGRPSSAGSGSRPSTAGSDRTYERTANVWGPSSRPSSASGVLASNQTSTSLRPQSAETRPSSSQLSRFAETVSDSTGLRAPSGTAERVGVASSENDRFSLSTGDFPTLNSSRDGSAKNSEPRDQGSHSRPSSASGTQRKEKTEESQAGQDITSGTVNAWDRDGPRSADDGMQPSQVKWHGEPQQYVNSNIPPPQFDAWRGPPMNAPAGVWYRGPPAGPPYGAPVAPGGFPIEPFPYYCPQIPPPALPNSQPVPLPGAGPRGHHPKNGELYRPQMPEAFVRPGMPFRPGFYPGPMHFEGYYGPPMGYCNSNEREVPFKGMGGPSAYNRHSTPSAPDPGHSRARAGRTGPAGKMLSEHVETAHSGDASGQYKVLLKQHDEGNGKGDGENLERRPTFDNSSHPKKGVLSGVSLRREWGAEPEPDSEEEMCAMRTEGENSCSHKVKDQGAHDPDTFKVQSFENVCSAVVDNNQKHQSVTAAPSPGMSQPSPGTERGLTVTATARDSTLMQKIEGLNVKVRASDGRYDGPQNSSQAVNPKGNDMIKAGIMGPGSHEMLPSVGDRSSHPAFAPRRAYDHMHGKGSDNGKGRFRSLDGGGWQKKPVAAEPASIPAAEPASIPAADIISIDVHETKVQPVVAAVEDPTGKNEGEMATEIFDSTDSQAQRAKMRELAKQRALQLQKEEEERIREQKAKAFAKLEELNRRTQGGKPLKNEKALVGMCQPELQEQQTYSGSSLDDAKSQAVTKVISSVSGGVTQSSLSTVPSGDESATSSSNLPKAVPIEPVVLDGQSLPLKQEAHSADANDRKTSAQMNEGGASRHKRNSFKPKQNATQEKKISQQSEAISAAEGPKNETGITSNEVNVVSQDDTLYSGESNFPRNPNIVSESSAQQRRKGNRSGKKHKLDDAPSMPILPSTAPNESNPVEAYTEKEDFKASQSDLDSSVVQEVITTVDGAESSKQHSSLQGDEAYGRLSNHRKPQHSRRFARNQQSNRFTDKSHGNDVVIWAPVKSQSKAEPASEMSQQNAQECGISAKCDNQVQSNIKSKRAEMERYVPKPVAKELAQQNSVQQPVSYSTEMSTSDEFSERIESGLASSGSLHPGSSATCNVASTAECREVDSRLNKQVKAHGAWRQRGSTEAPQNASPTSSSNSSKSTRTSVRQNQSVKPNLNSAKVEGNVSRDSSASDGQNVSTYSNVAAPALSPVAKDQGVTGKGKKHSLKADKSMGFNHDNEKNQISGEADGSRILFLGPDIKHAEKVNLSKESRGFEERSSSHWQPKSNSSSNNSQRGNRSILGQAVTVEKDDVKKDYPSLPSSHVPPNVKESSEKDSLLDQTSENVGHQGHRKERRMPTSKGHSHSPNGGTNGADESRYTINADPQNKQHLSSDIKRGRTQNNYPGTSREPRGDWNNDRQRHNIHHYEYHPVGSYNNSKPEKPEDEYHNAGQRYKDRGLGQSKRGRGNFHGRQSGSIRLDAGSG
ncbi:protein MODIFIER OF SNC1 1-like isoform X1 [Coffea arabica]|uniref:Protein MODIFIER OF SNC1 1-like isoform X1 n=1 Tax=Coffea arabica TaxID=13443 RepID=A0ABM4U4C9_COFAR|nr:protein MODIFIER OF SNC1 1-like isoform X1 [Coffea arabica]